MHKPQNDTTAANGSIYHDPFEDTERQWGSFIHGFWVRSIYHDPFEDTERVLGARPDSRHNAVPSTTIRLRILKVVEFERGFIAAVRSIYHDPFEDTERLWRDGGNRHRRQFHLPRSV